MFRAMRRQEKQLSLAGINNLLQRAEYGVLATVSENNYPYTTPLNYVYSKQKIYFHSALEGEKVDNIVRNSRVSFCVVADVKLLPAKFDTNYSSVVLFGMAEEVFAAEKEAALVAIIEKYSSKFIEAGKKYVQNSGHTTRVFGITIESLTGKCQQ